MKPVGGVLPPQGATVRRVAEIHNTLLVEQDAEFDVLPAGWQLPLQTEVAGFSSPSQMEMSLSFFLNGFPMLIFNCK